MLCSKCGTPSSSEDEFCRKCGSRLNLYQNDIPSNTIAKRKKQIQLAKIIIPILAVVVTGAILIANFVIIPASKYKTARKLLADGRYEDAKALFYKLNDYKDSAKQLDISINKILENAKVGSLIYWGQYEQDNNSANGKEYLAWKVLAVTEGQALLISEKNLDCQPYNISNESVTWATSTLRGWLNTTFLSEAFTAEDQSKIIETDLINNDNPENGTPGGDPTKDKISLLSIEEANQYFSNDATRIGANTPYAVSRGAYGGDGNGFWWLRSPGGSGRLAALVTGSIAANASSGGSVNEYGDAVDNDNRAVRPAFWIKLKS